MNNVHTATNTDFYKSEIYNGSLQQKEYLPTKQIGCKFNEQELVDHCGSSEISIGMKDDPNEIEGVTKKRTKDNSIPENMKMYLDSFNRRLERMEKSILSFQELRE